MGDVKSKHDACETAIVKFIRHLAEDKQREVEERNTTHGYDSYTGILDDQKLALEELADRIENGEYK